MNYEAKQLWPLYKKLNKQKPLPNGTKELIAAVVSFDMQKATGRVRFKSRQSNEEYLKKELDWYLSQSLRPPEGVKVWQQVKSKHGFVNSNYGYLIFSKGNCEQFQHAMQALIADPGTRQAVLVYNRPSMHEDWNKDGMHDFVCTFFQQFFIREGKLECVTVMRSNDCVFGTFNDVPWFEWVYNNMLGALGVRGVKLKKGQLRFIASSFHCYQRHYGVLEQIAKHG